MSTETNSNGKEKSYIKRTAKDTEIKLFFSQNK